MSFLLALSLGICLLCLRRFVPMVRPWLLVKNIKAVAVGTSAMDVLVVTSGTFLIFFSNSYC